MVKYVIRINKTDRENSKIRIIERCQIYSEELIMIALHPDRIKRWLEKGFTLDDM
jgi:hypothetical protein